MPPPLAVAVCRDPDLRSFYLRRSFQCPAGAGGELRLASRQWALVWVNGQYVGRTYERTHDEDWRFRSFDLTPHLRAGGNVVALLLHHWGEPDQAFAGVMAAAPARFAAAGTAGDADFADLAAWRMLPAPDLLTAPRHNNLIGHEELRDLRREPVGWRDPGFDDRAWTQPAIERIADACWQPSMLRPLAEEIHAPVRVVADGTLIPGAGWTIAAAGRWWRVRFTLAAPRRLGFIYPLRVGSRIWIDGAERSPGMSPPLDWSGEPESLALDLPAGEHELCGFHPVDGEFAFGWSGGVPAGGDRIAWSAERTGPFADPVSGQPAPRIALLTHQAGGAPLARLGEGGALDLDVAGHDHLLVVAFADSLTMLPRVRIAAATAGAELELIYAERMSDLPGMLLREAYRDRAILRDGAQEWAIGVQYKSARVLGLIVRPNGGRVRIAGLDAVFRHYAYDQSGVFASSDRRLDGVWSMCRHTMLHGSQDFIMDGPWREQLLYIGDNYVHNQACYHLFANHEIVAWQHTLYAQGQMPDGIFQPNQPSRTSPEHYRLLDQTILWPIQLWHHLLYTGRADFIHPLLPNVQRLLAGFHDRFAIAGDPRLRGLTGWNWVDHPGLLGDGRIRSIRHDGIPSAINLLQLLARTAAARLLDHAGRTAEADAQRAVAAQLADRLRREHWDAARGLFADCLVDGRPSPEASLHVNLLAILAGLCDDPAGVLARTWRQPAVTQILGPFFRVHLLEVLHRLGRHDDLLAEIRDHWGPYVDSGLSTVPEYVCVNGHWGSSLGHPWGAAPALYLAKALAGLEPLAPGWRRVRVAPRLGDLERLDCTVPVPGGAITARWRRRPDGGVAGTISAPTGIALEIDPGVQLLPS